MTTAGHTFLPDPFGRLVCTCGRRWIDIAGATRDAIGHAGWAHIGALSASEYEEIAAAREAAWLRGLGRGTPSELAVLSPFQQSGS